MDRSTRNHAYERRIWVRIAVGEIEVEVRQQRPYTYVELRGVTGGIGSVKYQCEDTGAILLWSEREGYKLALTRAVASAGRAATVGQECAAVMTEFAEALQGAWAEVPSATEEANKAPWPTPLARRPHAPTTGAEHTVGKAE